MHQGIHDYLMSEGLDGLAKQSYTLDDQIHNVTDDAAFKGWYVGSEFQLDNGEHIVTLTIGNWRSGKKYHYSSKPNLDEADQRKLDRLQKERLATFEKYRKEMQLKTAESSQKIFATFDTDGLTPYMERKLIPELYGCRIRKAMGAVDLIVPMRDVDDFLWGYQIISEDGSKSIREEQKLEETFHLIGGPINSQDVVYICEGFATGVSIYKAIQKPVLCTFTAQNLPKVAKRVRETYEDVCVVIAGDDDKWGKDNQGREMALEAQDVSFGLAIFPFFPDHVAEKKPTDFNDLEALKGLQECTEQIMLHKPPRPPKVFFLGYSGKNYFYSTTQNPQISPLSDFSTTELYKLLDSRYWKTKFPTYIKKEVQVDLDKAKAWLIENNRRRGPFNSGNQRGRGVWMDRQRIVYHLGQTMYVAENKNLETLTETHIQALQDSKYIYTFAANIGSSPAETLSVLERESLRSICHQLKWKYPHHAQLFLGWLILSPLSGALRWRPHIWMTGQKGSGKSTVMDEIVSPIFSEIRHFKGQKVTEAGLRQEVRRDACPVVLDEFEPTDGAYKQILQLARVASSRDGKLFKGTVTGDAMEFNASFSACFASIDLPHLEEADKSRIAVLELSGDEQNEWPKLRTLIQNTLTEDFSKKFMWTALRVLPMIQASSDMMTQAFVSLGHGARYGDLYGGMLAGLFCFTHERTLTLEEAKTIATEWLENENKFDNIDDTSSQEDCIEHLLNFSIRVDTADGTKMMPLKKVIENHETYNSTLENYGLQIKSENGHDGLFVPSKNPQLADIFKGTQWSGDWKQPLKRLPEATFANYRQQKDKSRKQKSGIFIPLKTIHIDAKKDVLDREPS
jgi:putative DNA primase/helicase